jgi:TetR/AcrR family transcriptional repressor of lmrAB and yxaGH operons
MPRKSDSRDKMIRAAGRLMRRQGFAQTGWRQIVEESGAPWGSVGHHFPGGKEQLAAEALGLEGERVRAEIAAALRDTHPADMVVGWAGFAATLLETTGWAEGCPIATAVLETAHDSAPLASVCSAAFVSWEREFEAAMRRRRVSAKDAQALAMLIVASMEGSLMLARAARSTIPLHTVAQQLATLLRDRVQ